MSILWILDTRNSALTISARLNSKHGDQFLFGTEYPSLASLIKKVLELKSKYIIFAWRQPLLDAQSSTKVVRLLNQIPSERKILFHVADIANLDNYLFNLEIESSKYVDGILFTSEFVRSFYIERLPTQVTTGVLHDKIDDSKSYVLNKVISKKHGQIIWVGNSTWGQRSGHIDHKGYKKIVEPLQDYCRSIDCNHTYVIIDSAVNPQPNDQVLRSIRESDFLLMPSLSEGTGMPLLEALSLRTVPLASATGIAPEVLCGELEMLLLPRTLEAFKNALHDQRLSRLIDSNELRDAFEIHTSRQIPIDSILRKLTGSRDAFKKSEIASCSGYLYLARFLKSKLKAFISH